MPTPEQIIPVAHVNPRPLPKVVTLGTHPNCSQTVTMLVEAIYSLQTRVDELERLHKAHHDPSTGGLGILGRRV